MTRPDFPKTIFEFRQRFSTEEACLDFLNRSRWPDGFVCPRCDNQDYYWKFSRRLLQCKKCGHQTSATAGTIMHRSKMPLTAWFEAAYQATTHTPGISALQFQRQLGISSYQTSFMMLHKLRAAMVKQGRDRLSGIVQVDETYVGGEKPGLRGRGASGKVIVACAAEIRGDAVTRIRLRVIPNVTSDTLTKFVKSNVVEGSTIVTDDWSGYSSLRSNGYRHIVDSTSLRGIHHIFSNLKTWIVGIHHGVSPQHLQAYLNEFTFRFNRRRTPMAAFQTVLGLVGQRKGPTYRELVGIAKHSKIAWVHPNPKGGIGS